MAISASDPYYRAETTPASITALGVGLRAAYRQPATAFGAKGNLAHDRGYHRSRTWVLRSPDSARGSRDYSVQDPRDLFGPASDVSAFDFTPGEWGSLENRRRMAELTRRALAAARAGDVRMLNLREFAGTLDGKTVTTFRCSDGAIISPFDASHLDHVHGSFWRSCAANDHAGLLAVLLGKEGDMSDFTNKDPNAWTQARRVESLHKNLTETVKDAAGGGEPNGLRAALDKLQTTMDEIRTALGQGGGGVPAGGPTKEEIAVAVADELHRRGAE